MSFVFMGATKVVAEVGSPTITSFSPEGEVGSTVKIKGTNLKDLDGVFFGSVEVFNADIHPVDTTELNVVVPVGAKTGKIKIQTASKGSVSTATDFIVTASKNLSNLIISIKDLAPTSVSILATGTSTATSYEFYIYDIENTSSPKTYLFHKVVSKPTTSNEVKADFIELKAGNDYIAKVKVAELTYEIKFTTPPTIGTLSQVIGLASGMLDKAVEGYTEGQYASGSIAVLSNAIDKAEKVSNDINKSQADIDKAALDLQTAIGIFESNKIPPQSSSSSSSFNPDTADIEKNGIVPKCNVGEIDKVSGQYKVPCDFNFFFELINNIIKFLLFVIATPLIALIIMYTGYLYITAGGSEGKVEKVKHILWNAVIGYVIALSAWLIVNTIISVIKIDPTINTFMENGKK